MMIAIILTKVNRKEVKIMTNNEIRSKAKEKSVKLWQIADALGINDGNFSRKLRHELPEEEKNKILALIDEIAEKESEKQ